MAGDTYSLDMSMMLAVHGALRRELDRLARVTARLDDDPRKVLRTALGWELFKTFLRVHHTAEDETVWPVMDDALVDDPDGLALLDAMEAEHAVIEPLLTAVDATLADRNAAAGTVADLVETLRVGLGAHLRHEEVEGLALIDSTLTPQQWAVFGADHRARIGSDASRYLPWVLDGAGDDVVAGILGHLPQELRDLYRDDWKAAYRGLDLWGAREIEPPARESHRNRTPVGSR